MSKKGLNLQPMVSLATPKVPNNGIVVFVLVQVFDEDGAVGDADTPSVRSDASGCIDIPAKHAALTGGHGAAGHRQAVLELGGAEHGELAVLS